jgi:hypothetical protein
VLTLLDGTMLGEHFVAQYRHEQEAKPHTPHVSSRRGHYLVNILTPEYLMY